MKPSGIIFCFALSYSVAFKDFSVCLFNLSWYFDYHLFAHFAKALLACNFLSKQCCLNCDCFEFRAIVESFCFDYFYVSSNGSFGKFLQFLKALVPMLVTLYVTPLYLIVAGMESALIPAFALLKRTSEPTFVTVY